MFRTLAAFCIALPLAAQVSLIGDEPLEDKFGNAIPFDSVVDDWISDSDVVKPLRCTVGGQQVDCLFVPKRSSSSDCDGTIDYGICGILAGQQDANHFCLISDEFSQVGLALAMREQASAIPDAFHRWTNTVRALRRASAPRLPVWTARVAVSGDVATIEPASDDDASDATARVIYALYVASTNPEFSSQQQADYRALADDLTAAFVSDFVDYAAAGMNYWLATGWVTGQRPTPFWSTEENCTLPNCNPFTFAGYHGDVVIALLAAYRSTGNDLYREMALDTIDNYLLAAGFTTTFRVPPPKFVWKDTATGVQSECVQYCANQWDDADAPRAISLCKAKYYADLAGVGLGSTALVSYCTAWLNRAGAFVTTPEYRYSRQYTFDGNPLGAATGYTNNGLGSYMHFAFGTAQLRPRLEEAFGGHYDSTATPPRFDTGSSNCMGAYFPAFPIVSYGSAIGRDRAAFLGGIPQNLVATATSATNVSLAWTAVPGASSYVVERRSAGTAFVQIGTPTTPSFNDTVGSATSHLYRVRSVAGGAASSPGNVDLATTVQFTSEPVARASHLQDLRTAINSVRALAGLPALTLDISPGDLIQAMHVTTLRDGLNPARTTLGILPVTFCQPSLVAGSTIQACDVEELREGVR